jgi:hypothetical protein
MNVAVSKERNSITVLSGDSGHTFILETPRNHCGNSIGAKLTGEVGGELAAQIFLDLPTALLCNTE